MNVTEGSCGQRFARLPFSALGSLGTCTSTLLLLGEDFLTRAGTKGLAGLWCLFQAVSHLWILVGARGLHLGAYWIPSLVIPFVVSCPDKGREKDEGLEPLTQEARLKRWALLSLDKRGMPKTEKAEGQNCFSLSEQTSISLGGWVGEWDRQTDRPTQSDASVGFALQSDSFLLGSPEPFLQAWPPAGGGSCQAEVCPKEATQRHCIFLEKLLPKSCWWWPQGSWPGPAVAYPEPSDQALSPGCSC